MKKTELDGPVTRLVRWLYSLGHKGEMIIGLGILWYAVTFAVSYLMVNLMIHVGVPEVIGMSVIVVVWAIPLYILLRFTFYRGERK